jgi:uncharacterized protein YbjT (DUF2867 family)
VIVIVGGTGLLGRLVVDDLLARNEKVRVVVRDIDSANARRLSSHVELVAADVRRPEPLRDAVDGAGVVISAVHGFLGGRGAGPDDVDRIGNSNLVAAVQAVGAGVVLVSIVGASADSPLDLFRAKHAAEQNVRGSGVPWTIVRATAFLETWLQVLTQTAGKSGRPLIFGRGDQPIPFVSARDVAALVGAAATNASYCGRVLEIAGAPLTMNSLASSLKEAHGWSGSPRHLPRGLLRMLALVTGRIQPAFARQNRTALAMDTTTLGDLASSTSPLGVPLRTVADVLRDATAL